MVDNTKLPAVCIFKLKNILRESFPEGNFIYVNKKVWYNEQEMF